jgi:hypothetical protein
MNLEQLKAFIRDEIRKGTMREIQDISVLIKSVQSLTPVDLSWAKEVIDTESKLRLDKQMEQIRYQKQQQVRAVPRISEYERTPDAVTPSGTKIWTDDNRQVQNVEMAGCVGTDLHVSESGATSSHVPLRYDLIPRSLLERAAERYTMGAQIHSERGYQRGLAEREFIINRINHITEHLNKLLHPDYRKADSPQDEEGIEVKSINDNLGAILWGVGFLCEVADHKEGIKILHELRSSGRLKVTTD